MKPDGDVFNIVFIYTNKKKFRKTKTFSNK